MDCSITLRPPVAYPTEANTTIEVGDRVRSFDYSNESGCYFVGTVTDVDEAVGVYNIKVEFQVWEGKRAETNYCASVHPPINGLRGMLGLTMGVQRMDEGEVV